MINNIFRFPPTVAASVGGSNPTSRPASFYVSKTLPPVYSASLPLTPGNVRKSVIETKPMSATCSTSTRVRIYFVLYDCERAPKCSSKIEHYL